jgi:hypothetical protein
MELLLGLFLHSFPRFLPFVQTTSGEDGLRRLPESDIDQTFILNLFLLFEKWIRVRKSKEQTSWNKVKLILVGILLWGHTWT